MSSIYQIVRQAIIEQKPLRLEYKENVREVCPHAIGRKYGRPKLLCYQFGGRSSSGLERDGSPNNWRCMFVDEIKSAAPMEEGSWHTAPNHSRPQTCIDEIDVEMKY